MTFILFSQSIAIPNKHQIIKKDYGIEVGKIADLVLLEADSVSAAIGTAPLNRTTIKGGQIVAQSKCAVSFKETEVLRSKDKK